MFKLIIIIVIVYLIKKIVLNYKLNNYDYTRRVDYTKVIKDSEKSNTEIQENIVKGLYDK